MERPHTDYNLDAAVLHRCKSISIAASEFKAIVTIKTATKQQAPNQTQMYRELREAEEQESESSKGQGQALVKATYMAVEQRASLTG